MTESNSNVTSPITAEKTNLRELYRWVPSAYLMQGLPFALVTAVSLILYKNFNFSNAKITFYTSLFAFPWFLKPLFAPAMENLATKRTLILSMQFLMAGLSVLLAFSLYFKDFFYVSGGIFFAIAFASAIHDMNLDGLYIINLDRKSQAHFIGIKTLFYQFGRFICQAAIVFIAGSLFLRYNIQISWQIVLIILSVFIFFVAIYHRKTLPFDKVLFNNVEEKKHNALQISSKIFKDLLQTENLFLIVVFLLFYNFPENQLVKIAPLFLLDKIDNGGLELSTRAVGLINGGLGFFGMLSGVLLSGFLIEGSSLKTCLLPFTIFVAITNISYLLLSYFSIHSLWAIGFFITLAQFGYGVCNGAYMFFLLLTMGRGPYPMSLYAIGTSLMGFGMMFGGAVSGYLQYLLGYNNFFIWIILISFGIIILSFYIIRKDITNIEAK